MLFVSSQILNHVCYTLPKIHPVGIAEGLLLEEDKMNGQPCIRNLRLTVRRVIDLLAIYPDRKGLFEEFPQLAEADIQQALIFAASYFDDRIIELPQT